MCNNPVEIYFSDNELEDEGIIIIEHSNSNDSVASNIEYPPDQVNYDWIYDTETPLPQYEEEKCKEKCDTDHTIHGAKNQRTENVLSREAIESEENVEENKDKFAFRNKEIPEMFKWTAYDESIQGIVSPELAKRMMKLRLGIGHHQNKEQILMEAAVIWTELRDYKNREMIKRDRALLVGELKDAEERANKYYIAWKKELGEKNKEENTVSELKTRVKAGIEELVAEKEKAKATSRICRMLECEIEDKNERIRKLLKEKENENRQVKIIMEEVQMYKGLYRENLMKLYN
jgi:hypothetical protein